MFNIDLHYYNLVCFTGILNSPPDEHDLLTVLADMDAEWHKLGLALKVPDNILNRLTQSHDSNVFKLKEIIHSWLITTSLTSVTWETVINAIKGSIINNNAKANEIRHYLGLAKGQ